MKRFLQKLAALSFGLISFLLVDGLLFGSLSFTAFVFLMPAASLLTIHLLHLSLTPVRRRASVAQRRVRPVAARSLASQPMVHRTMRKAPALYLAPKHSNPPHHNNVA